MVVSTVKVTEMRERTIEELQEDIVSLRKKLFELRLAKSMHKLENTAELSKVKNEIAQLKTIIRETRIVYPNGS